ncbi:MAG TPA: glycosyltransferase [Chlamydiales bacterium]|nr:glycosyltransferase [Chlamydiales bacterium]
MKSKLLLVLFVTLTRLQATPCVPFETSMNTLVKQLPTENKDWQLLSSLYKDYCNSERPTDTYIIPKMIHLIWLGSPMPEECKLTLVSWEKFHPDWVVKVWTDADTASFPFINREAFDRAQNFGEKSDIWRYEILYRYGGLYVDTDFECLQPFDFLHRSCEFYTGVGQNVNPQLWIGLIGSVSGHPILKATIDNLRTSLADHNYERIMSETGAYLFTRMFLAVAPQCKRATVVPFPVTFFYPFPGGERHRKDVQNIKREFLCPESMAIHYFATSWQRDHLPQSPNK